MAKPKSINLRILLACFVVLILVATIGSLLTQNSKSQWYESTKPSITPPSFVFPIVWTALFILIAISFYLVIVSGKLREKVIFIYVINFIFNIFWSYLYFYLKNPRFAFFEIIVLWASIISMIYVSWKIDKKAAWLLVPYLLWVSFAVILNYLSIR